MYVYIYGICKITLRDNIFYRYDVICIRAQGSEEKIVMLSRFPWTKIGESF